MKKTICIAIISVLLIILIPAISFASNVSSYTFYYSDREITIETAYLNETEAHSIADFIAYGIVPTGYIEPENTMNTPLLCILFGHSIETSYAFETIHNVYTTSPKCDLNQYCVEICTRTSCDYIQKTLIDSSRISYCHG